MTFSWLRWWLIAIICPNMTYKEENKIYINDYNKFNGYIIIADNIDDHQEERRFGQLEKYHYLSLIQNSKTKLNFVVFFFYKKRLNLQRTK